MGPPKTPFSCGEVVVEAFGKVTAPPAATLHLIHLGVQGHPLVANAGEAWSCALGIPGSLAAEACRGRKSCLLCRIMGAPSTGMLLTSLVQPHADFAR